MLLQLNTEADGHDELEDTQEFPVQPEVTRYYEQVSPRLQHGSPRSLTSVWLCCPSGLTRKRWHEGRGTAMKHETPADLQAKLDEYGLLITDAITRKLPPEYIRLLKATRSAISEQLAQMLFTSDETMLIGGKK